MPFMTNEYLHNSGRSGQPAGASNSASAASVAKRQSEALRGAVLAFGKPATRPKPAVNRHIEINGASSVARSSTGADRMREHSPELSIIVPHNSGGSVRQLQNASFSTTHQPQAFNRTETSLTLVPPLRPQPREKSPSFIAATLAASRSGPLTPAKPDKAAAKVAAQIQRQSSTTSRSSRGSTEPEKHLDTTSIPPTSTLINIFEQQTNREGKPSKNVQRDMSPQAEQTFINSVPTIIHSPKPVRIRPPTIDAVEMSPTRQLVPSYQPTATLNTVVNSKTGYTHSVQGRRFDASLASASAKPGSNPLHSGIETKPMPSLHKNSGGSFAPPKPPIRSRSALSGFSEQDALTIDQMANAIVASSLASSRVVSPRGSTDTEHPLLPPRRASKNFFHIHHTGDSSLHKFHHKSTPSPVKGMRQTMRKPRSDSEDEGTKKRVKTRNPLNMKKHPNKHNEGNRKRWRDIVTERERKRYEAVWASNKGLYMSPDLMHVHATTMAPLELQHTSRSSIFPMDPAEDYKNVVLNIVARDIWSRSRLPHDVLEEVWDLVDRNAKGYLEKEEFVAGLWLIDQRLKGRKLPVKVSGSVWESVGLAGLKIKAKTIGNKKRERKSH